jgi:hypothetical protein
MSEEEPEVIIFGIKPEKKEKEKPIEAPIETVNAIPEP